MNYGGRTWAMALCVTAVALWLLGPRPVAAQGVWFDIGSGEPTTIFCPTDSASKIEFPAYPFGESWPPGSLVWASLVQDSEEGFAGLYRILFTDGGCGCGTRLQRPMTYYFHYNEVALQWPEDSTALFVKGYDRWLEVVGVSLDTAANILIGEDWQLVGSPTFGIGPRRDVSDEAVSWGRIKALYK